MNNTLPPITMELLSAQKHKCLAELMSPSTTIWNSHTVLKASKKGDRPDCTFFSTMVRSFFVYRALSYICQWFFIALVSCCSSSEELGCRYVPFSHLIKRPKPDMCYSSVQSSSVVVGELLNHLTVNCSFSTVSTGTVFDFESVPHAPSCCCKYSQMHHLWCRIKNTFSHLSIV